MRARLFSRKAIRPMRSSKSCKGKIKLTVVSNAGKEAVIAVLGPGDFFGEGCLAGQQLRMSTATAMTECSIRRLERATVMEMLQTEPAFSKLLLSYMLTRTIRIEEDLIDQLFNSSEKRLARALLLLANFGKEGKPETVIPKISQETLADMIGTTRSRVSFFMNKFRRLGLSNTTAPSRSTARCLTSSSTISPALQLSRICREPFLRLERQGICAGVQPYRFPPVITM